MESPGRGRGAPVTADSPDSPEGFEAWLLRRVAQAVEAGDVSGDLLTALQTELEAAQESSLEEAHTDAVQYLANLMGVTEEKARSTIEAIDTQPTAVREFLLRRFVEAWIERQRKVYRERGRGGCPQS
jgi:hypothetical protein